MSHLDPRVGDPQHPKFPAALAPTATQFLRSVAALSKEPLSFECIALCWHNKKDLSFSTALNKKSPKGEFSGFQFSPGSLGTLLEDPLETRKSLHRLVQANVLAELGNDIFLLTPWGGEALKTCLSSDMENGSFNLMAELINEAIIYRFQTAKDTGLVATVRQKFSEMLSEEGEKAIANLATKRN